MASCLVIKNDGIGDLICASGVISQLATLYNGHLDLVTCIQNKEIAERIPGVRKVLYVSRDQISSCRRSISRWRKIPWLGKKEPPFSTQLIDYRVFLHLLSTKYDMVVCLRRFIRYSAAMLMHLTRATEKFCCWNITTNTDSETVSRLTPGWQILTPYKKPMWEPLFYGKFLEQIFPGSIKIDPVLNLPEAVDVQVPDGSVGCIITDRSYRSWPDSYWETFIESLSRAGRRVYLFGSATDRSGIRKKHAGNAALVDCCGTLDIIGHVPYFRRLETIVAEDTGLAHLAALCGSNVLVLQASGNCDGFFFPWVTPNARTQVIAHSMSCNNIYLLSNPDHRMCKHFENKIECIWRVTPQDVLSVLADVLADIPLPKRVELNKEVTRC